MSDMSDKTWIKRVEAAMDRYGTACANPSTGSFERQAAHAALLALVTKGRCPRCGSATIITGAVLRPGKMHLKCRTLGCGWCGTTP